MDIKERTNTPVPADALIVETVFGAQQVFEMLKKKKTQSHPNFGVKSLS